MKINNLLKKHLSTLMYSLFGFVTLVGSVSLFTWSILGEQAEKVETLPAIVLSSEESQKEYLVGQTFNTKGLSLNIGSESRPKIIDIDDCVINANFTSAGYTRVEVSYSPTVNKTYTGYYDVNVLFVRSLKVLNAPKDIKVDEETKTFKTDEEFKVVAELATKPTTSDFEYYLENQNIFIELEDDMYTTSVVESAKIDDYYSASLYCGNLKYSFNFYNNDDKTFLIKDEKDIVFFENENGDSENKLILVVTNRDVSYQTNCVGNTTGYYIYENGNQKDIFNFNFELKETEEVFNSLSVLESKDAINNLYKVSINNDTFVSESSLWQSAVVNGLIYDDGGYKLVAASNSRILELEYIDVDDDKDNNPTLSLYVSTFSFDTSTGSGISQGFYIFKTFNGDSYKAPFYLQTWTWDHVPLSGLRGDYDSYCSVGDYLDAQYSGNLCADISVFIRGEGRSNYQFRASFDAWRLVAYNMA